jgi:hypothetical protein
MSLARAETDVARNKRLKLELEVDDKNGSLHVQPAHCNLSDEAPNEKLFRLSTRSAGAVRTHWIYSYYSEEEIGGLASALHII